MRTVKRAKLLRVHFAESDRWAGRPMHEAVVQRCREMGIAGITVFRGLEGFGDKAEMRRGGLLHHDQPIVATIVDSAENVERIAAELEGMIEGGVIVVSEVEAIRVEKGGQEARG